MCRWALETMALVAVALVAKYFSITKKTNTRSNVNTGCGVWLIEHMLGPAATTLQVRQKR